ncbi:MAG: hypothetical protein PVI82_12320 [Desulfobacterales bacterium]
MPPYLKWNRARRLEGAVINLTTDLEMAKVRAIRENAFVVVEFNADRYTMFVDSGDGMGGLPNWSRDADERQIFNRKMPAGGPGRADQPDLRDPHPMPQSVEKKR